MKRRTALVVRVICVLAVGAGAATYAARDRPHGTVATLSARLEQSCGAVEHHRYVGALAVHPPMRGAISDDSLECKGEDGSVHVIAFRSATAREAGLAKTRRLRGTCLIGRDEAALNGLSDPGMGASFRRWCSELGGHLG